MKIINICGCGHSGTTMLEQMVANGPGIFASGECYAWFRPRRKHHLGIQCFCGSRDCQYWEKIKQFKESEFHIRAMKELGVGVITDSSKSINWVVDNNTRAIRSGAEVRNILIWKEPISFAYSMWKRGQFKQWREVYIGYHLKFFETGLPFVSVKFEDLVAESGQKLGQLCSSVGIDYFEGKNNFWEKVHHNLYGSGSLKKSLNRTQKKIHSIIEYKPEFESLRQKLANELQKDKIVCDIVEKLKVRDVKFVKEEDVSWKEAGHINRPCWYYWNIVKYKMRGFAVMYLVV